MLLAIFESGTMRVEGHAAGAAGQKCTLNVGKRPLGRHRGRWDDNTNMDLRDI
jgi:hypothetical protein